MDDEQWRSRSVMALDKRLAAGEWPSLGRPSGEPGDPADGDLALFLTEAVRCRFDPESDWDAYVEALDAWLAWCELPEDDEGGWPEGVARPWWLAAGDPSTLTWSSPE